MRILKAFGMTMLVSGLVLGLAVAVTAATDTADVSASFTIPSWISLSVDSGGSVNFGNIVGGGGSYEGDVDTVLRVLSTKSWAITRTIVWGSSSLSAEAQAVIEAALGTTSISGSWGISSETVSYAMTITDEDMALFPEGTHSMTIRYMATTD